MKLRLSIINLSLVSFLFLVSENLSSQENQQVFEEVIVTAEKKMRAYRQFLKQLPLLHHQK